MANVRLKNIQFPGLDNTYTIPDEAPAYSTSGTYAVGDMVVYDGKLYKCITAITTAEAWTAAHWSETKMGNEVSELKTALNELGEVVGDPLYDIGSELTITTVNGWWNATTGQWASNNSYLSAKVPVTAGNLYAVTAAVYKSTNFALAVFLDSSDNLVGTYKRSDASSTVIYYDEIVSI